jgi:hypothetical protein
MSPTPFLHGKHGREDRLSCKLSDYVWISEMPSSLHQLSAITAASDLSCHFSEASTLTRGSLRERVLRTIRTHPGWDLEDLFDHLDEPLSAIAEAVDGLLREGMLETGER